MIGEKNKFRKRVKSSTFYISYEYEYGGGVINWNLESLC